ncbi:SnoaL-like domain protein [compost metagenome]
MSERILPEVVTRYLHASNDHDVEAYLNTFTEKAVIEEESIGRDLASKEEIRNYFETYFVKMNTHTEIIEYAVNDNAIDMRVLFKGDFPGKEIVGLYQFILRDGRIHKLKADLE